MEITMYEFIAMINVAGINAFITVGITMISAVIFLLGALCAWESIPTTPVEIEETVKAVSKLAPFVTTSGKSRGKRTLLNKRHPSWRKRQPATVYNLVGYARQENGEEIPVYIAA
jgi:hypothetical protein